ncbi:MAG: cobalt/nickel ABC transporter ATP-binding protein [Candidatus Bathyarchaeota archaeon B23]|nr:MAG: cobalt/nickel ABC transporter ATP-binding protein [Candidatus Bathyarchaeota archaeon B23]
MEAVVSFEEFSYSYPTREDVLVDIDFQVHRGEVLGVIGPNGAGKSTLCRCLNGLIPHFYGGRIRGKVIVAGLDTQEHSTAELSMKVGLLFQDPIEQLSGVALTVEEEVGFGLSMLGYPKEVIGERVAEAIERVGLKGLEGRSPYELSGGQQQRLALATVLAMRPEVIALDEPTALLDPIGKYEVFGVLRELASEGSTLMVVEHEIEELAYIADRILLLHGGRILSIDESKRVLSEVSRLKEIGVDPPSVTELTYLLEREVGVALGEYPTTLPEAVRLYGEVLRS